MIDVNFVELLIFHGIVEVEVLGFHYKVYHGGLIIHCYNAVTQLLNPM